MHSRWWVGIVAAFAVTTSQAHAQQNRALVIEGQADPAQLEELQREFGAGEIDVEGADVWLVTPEQDEHVRARLEGLGLDVEGVDRNFYSVLAPTEQTPDAQRAQIEELARDPDTRVTVLRSQPPQLAALAFSGGLAAPMAAVSDSPVSVGRAAFTIDLDGGRSFAFTPNFRAGEVWSGSSGNAVADLIYADGLISGYVQTSTSTIEILPLGDELYAAVETPNAPIVDDTADMAPAANSGAMHGPRTAACTTGNQCVIRIGVVYSREARLAAGAHANQILAQRPVEFLNASLSHAGLLQQVENAQHPVGPIRFQLFENVAMLDGPPTEPQRSSVFAQRNALLAPAQDSWEDRIHDWRRQHAIDIVVMVGRWLPAPGQNELCGKAGSLDYRRADLAYVVINYGMKGCVYAFSFGHEVGHLLGMAHDRRTLLIARCHTEPNEPPPPDWCDGFPASGSANFFQAVDQHCTTHQCPGPPQEPELGFCAQANGTTYGTFMSYPFNCGSNARYQAWWSNRNKTIEGTNVRIGDTNANQRSLLLTRARYVTVHSDHLQ